MENLQAITAPTTDAILEPSIVEAFRLTMRGEVLLPSDNGYETARKIWNASIDKRPGIIARCLGVADVMAAVNLMLLILLLPSGRLSMA